MIKIQVKVLGKNDVYEIEVPQDIQVARLKSIIQEKCDLMNNSIRLIFQGHSLKDEETLAHYHAKDGQKISVVPRNPIVEEVIEDPPPPQIGPQIPNAKHPQTQQDPLHSFRKDLINVGQSLSKISAVAAKFQMALNGNSELDIINVSKEFEQLHNSLFPQISSILNSLQNKKIVSKGNLLEIANAGESSRKPVVADILTSEEKEEILQQAAVLESYISSNTLHESFLSSSLSKALDSD